MNRYSLFQGRQAGTASEWVCCLANSGSGGCGFCPAKRWTRKCRVSGAGREGANDVSIRNMFCSVPTLCSLVSLLSSQLQLSLICGVGCAHLIVRLAWTLATPLALFFPSQKWTALLLRNRQRGSGKTCSRNQEPPEVRAPWARGNQMGFERKSSPHKHVRYQRSSCRVRDELEPALALTTMSATGCSQLVSREQKMSFSSSHVSQSLSQYQLAASEVNAFHDERRVP